MNRKRIYGLIISALSDAAGSPIKVSNFSQLYEEVSTTSSELYDTFVGLKELLRAEVLGDLEVAKQAMKNAANPDLSESERLVQLQRAWTKSEDAYNALTENRFLLNLKASVAEQIAFNFVAMGNKDLARSWFTFAKRDHDAFCAMPPEKLNLAEQIADAYDQITPDRLNSRGGGTPLDKAAIAAAGISAIVSAPLALTIAGVYVAGQGVGLACSFKTIESLPLKKKNNALLLLGQADSRESLTYIRQVLAKL
jgi:hypothetical protein